ncbi:MAG: hypothetical protein KatS3mg088_268 [Patescibacteria group bacterium]|nr:MAG: hypothetical protein KatS3mg088_268 [Patescibacteria group bacterium]
MENFRFELKGKTLVIVDWANVYGWFEKLKWEIDEKKLFKYLKSYSPIKEIRFYFGVEKGNKKSEEFQKRIKKIGYILVSKEVKWVPVTLDRTHFKEFLSKLFLLANILESSNSKIANLLRQLPKNPIYRRKCDFDCEISIDVMKNLNNYDGFILFSGDGDYAALIKEIINNRKQAIVVALKNSMGKEYTDIKKGLFICNVKKFKKFIKRNSR